MIRNNCSSQSRRDSVYLFLMIFMVFAGFSNQLLTEEDIRIMKTVTDNTYERISESIKKGKKETND